MSSTSKKEIEILPFLSSKDFETWMRINHASAPGLWLRLYKKNSRQETITYAEALDVALCYGWIDSQKKAKDAKSYLQKLTPRSANSIWSKVNRGHAERLIKEKRMKAPGKREIDAAKKDGRWDNAYDSSSTMKVPGDFLKELKKDAEAYEFFKTLNRANLYGIAWRLQTAKKPETRARRMKKLLAMLSQRKQLH